MLYCIALSLSLSVDTIRSIVLISLIIYIVLRIKIAVFSFTSSLKKTLINRLAIINYPVAYIVDNLLKILHSLEKTNINALGVQEKKTLILQLEEIAQCFDRSLPNQLSSEDIITNAWLRQAMREVATSLREKKRWLILPKSDTQSHFIDEISHSLICTIDGNWDALHRMKPEALSSNLTNSQLWRSRLFESVKTILIAIFPTIAFLIFEHTIFPITEPIYSYLIIGLFIWTVMVFIVALDPNFSTKISAIKDIKGLLTLSDNSDKS